jgi:hypothetical protein
MLDTAYAGGSDLATGVVTIGVPLSVLDGLRNRLIVVT